MPAVENDVMCALWLITITRKDDSDLIVGGIRKIVVATVTALIESQSYLALLFWTHVPGELMGLPVHLNCMVAMVKYILKHNQSVAIELGVPGIGHAKVDSISWKKRTDFG